jgi:hypothetical protein
MPNIYFHNTQYLKQEITVIMLGSSIVISFISFMILNLILLFYHRRLFVGTYLIYGRNT